MVARPLQRLQVAAKASGQFLGVNAINQLDCSLWVTRSGVREGPLALANPDTEA